jgi:shikimate dehydrogenase
MKSIYGLIGFPVKHSLSAFMHNAAFKNLGFNAEYKLFEVEPENLEKFLLEDVDAKDINGEPFRVRDIVGFNVTIPHKVAAKEILEKAFPKKNEKDNLIQINEHYVKISGAVNTVKREANTLNYWNTDASGFLRSLKEDLGFELNGKNVLIIGCGGAGRAIVAALSWKNIGLGKIFIYDISEKAIQTAREYFSKFDYVNSKINFIGEKELSEAIKKCQLLVNASGLGMKDDDASPIDKELLHSGLSVYDIIYNHQTQLLKDASDLDLRNKNGLGMLLYQGVEALELWLGQEAPVEIMRQALLIAAKNK